MAVARHHGASVTLTDVPWIVPLTRLNVDANFGAAEYHPSVAPLRWGSVPDVEALPNPRPDLVIASDII